MVIYHHNGWLGGGTLSHMSKLEWFTYPTESVKSARMCGINDVSVQSFNVNGMCSEKPGLVCNDNDVHR